MNDLTTPAWWPELASIPVDMAAQVASWLPSATLETYQRFLNMMYHYTLDSEARLRHAAALTPDDALRAFYLELADEEAPHYELARQDLASFGAAPSPLTPPEVASFQRSWAGVTSQGHAAHLGALYSLESVADHIAAQATAGLARLGLGPHNARFILVHLQADEVHGALCTQHCARVGATDLPALLQGARAAADAWIDMHRCLAMTP